MQVLPSESILEVINNPAAAELSLTRSSEIIITATDTYGGTTDYCAMPNQFFNYRDSSYDNEKLFYQKVTSEALDTNGVMCDYYVVDYSANNEKVFGEDNDKHVLRNFKVKVFYDVPPEQRQYNQIGMEDLDVFPMYVTKLAFNQYSNGYVPKYGDFIKPHYNSVLYEIVDVIDTDEQFLNTQITWKLTVKVWENNMVTTTSGVQDENLEKIYPFEVFFPKGRGNLPKDSKVKADQIRTIDKIRLRAHWGKLKKNEMEEVERALKIHLALT